MADGSAAARARWSAEVEARYLRRREPPRILAGTAAGDGEREALDMTTKLPAKKTRRNAPASSSAGRRWLSRGEARESRLRAGTPMDGVEREHAAAVDNAIERAKRIKADPAASEHTAESLRELRVMFDRELDALERSVDLEWSRTCADRLSQQVRLYVAGASIACEQTELATEEQARSLHELDVRSDTESRHEREAADRQRLALLKREERAFWDDPARVYLTDRLDAACSVFEFIRHRTIESSSDPALLEQDLATALQDQADRIAHEFTMVFGPQRLTEAALAELVADVVGFRSGRPEAGTSRARVRNTRHEAKQLLFRALGLTPGKLRNKTKR